MTTKSEKEIREITDEAFRRALDKRLSRPKPGQVFVTVDYMCNDPIVEVDATNHLIQSATKLPCLACNDRVIVDGEFDGALECACRKGTNQ